MKTIRHGVFETNSSSVHSVCIVGKSRRPSFASVGIYNAEVFGRGNKTLYGLAHKIAYMLSYLLHLSKIAWKCYDSQDEEYDEILRLMKTLQFKRLNKVFFAGYEKIMKAQAKMDKEKYQPSEEGRLSFLDIDGKGIDHQSLHLAEEIWALPDEKLEEFLFDDKYVLHIASDESDGFPLPGKIWKTAASDHMEEVYHAYRKK